MKTAELSPELSAKLEAFRALVESDQDRYRIASGYDDFQFDSICKTVVIPGKKWAKVDVGHSGKYMVEMATGEIVGIKAYGVPHLGHRCGTLDTIHEWDWSGYAPARKTLTAA